MENPFYITGIIPEPYFCDREKETQWIMRTLGNKAHILLTSPRRMGKTQLIQQNAKRLQELLAYVTEQQKEVLYAIAADKYVSRITSSDFVKRHHLKSASAVQSATKRLLDLDLITEQHKSYSVSDSLLRIWIVR